MIILMEAQLLQLGHSFFVDCAPICHSLDAMQFETFQSAIQTTLYGVTIFDLLGQIRNVARPSNSF